MSGRRGAEIFYGEGLCRLLLRWTRIWWDCHVRRSVVWRRRMGRTYCARVAISEGGLAEMILVRRRLEAMFW